MSKENVMTLSVVGLEDFAREIQYKGKTLDVVSVGTGNEFRKTERLEFLLKNIIFDHSIDVEILNEIGFSKEDASNLGLCLEGLDIENIPPEDEWEE